MPVVRMYVVILTDALGIPVCPPFVTTFTGDEEGNELAAELAEVFADDDDVHHALIGVLSDDPDEIADAILAASDPFGDGDGVLATV